MSAVLTRAIPRIARGACGYSANVGLASIATVSRCPRYVRFSSDSDQIADVPTRRIKCAPAARETACEPQVHPCTERRPRTSRTRAPVALTDPSEPWWTKPVHALQLQGLSWACDHRPWSCERVLYSLHRRVLAVLHLDPIGASPAAIGAIDALGERLETRPSSPMLQAARNRSGPISPCS